jgi:hypothetical protein
VTLSRPSMRGTEVPTMGAFFIRIAESSSLFWELASLY